MRATCLPHLALLHMFTRITRHEAPLYAVVSSLILRPPPQHPVPQHPPPMFVPYRDTTFHASTKTKQNYGSSYLALVFWTAILKTKY